MTLFLLNVKIIRCWWDKKKVCGTPFYRRGTIRKVRSLVDISVTIDQNLKLIEKDEMKCMDLYANLRMKDDLIWLSRNPMRFRKIFINL